MAKLRIIGKSYYADFYDYKGKRQRISIGKVGEITKTMAKSSLKAVVGDVVQGRFNLEENTKKPAPLSKPMRGGQVSTFNFYVDSSLSIFTPIILTVSSLSITSLNLVVACDTAA